MCAMDVYMQLWSVDSDQGRQALDSGRAASKLVAGERRRSNIENVYVIHPVAGSRAGIIDKKKQHIHFFRLQNAAVTRQCVREELRLRQGKRGPFAYGLESFTH